MEESFEKKVLNIAIPVALQSMLQSSFSMIDQIMVGQLGRESIAAVEIGAKPGFVYAFVIGAIGTIAGVMISQYIGKKDRTAEEKSICINSAVMLFTGMIFLMSALNFAVPFTSMFTDDAGVVEEGSGICKRNLADNRCGNDTPPVHKNVRQNQHFV